MVVRSFNFLGCFNDSDGFETAEPTLSSRLMVELSLSVRRVYIIQSGKPRELGECATRSAKAGHSFTKHSTQINKSNKLRIIRREFKSS